MKKELSRSELIVRIVVFVLCELLTVSTIIMVIATKQFNSRLFLSIGTVALIFFPYAIEKGLSCKMITPLYIFSMIYAVGPMLGQCYNLYYKTEWWDKVLHLCGGVIFAILGIMIFYRVTKGERKKLFLCAGFALCFSMALSMTWEFVEFGCDKFFGTDMQDDTVITSITSYALGDGIGKKGTIDNIKEVIVTGKKLPVNGYLDIGLIDTITDMMLESAGALVIALLLLIDKGKHTFFVWKDKGKKTEKKD